MTEESQILVLTVECERLRQENDRLRAENAALRPMVSDLQHKLRRKCEHCESHPHEAAKPDDHG